MAGVSFDREGAGRVVRATIGFETRNLSPPMGTYRRRFPRGEGGSEIYHGDLIAEVPASTRLIPFGGDAFEPDAVQLKVFDTTPIVQNYVDAGPEGAIELIGAFNRSFTAIRGSLDYPISVWGLMRNFTFLETPEYNGRYLEIMWYDMSSLPNFQRETPDLRPQGPFHLSGYRQFQLDGGPCE